MFREEGARLNRRVFRSIIEKYARWAIEQPDSQVCDKRLSYMINFHVFSLRCKNRELVQRNQIR